MALYNMRGTRWIPEPLAQVLEVTTHNTKADTMVGTRLTPGPQVQVLDHKTWHTGPMTLPVLAGPQTGVSISVLLVTVVFSANRTADQVLRVLVRLVLLLMKQVNIIVGNMANTEIQDALSTILVAIHRAKEATILVTIILLEHQTRRLVHTVATMILAD